MFPGLIQKGPAIQSTSYYEAAEQIGCDNSSKRLNTSGKCLEKCTLANEEHGWVNMVIIINILAGEFLCNLRGRTWKGGPCKA